ncbi:CPBP family intramembrane metalloprotease [Vibrio kasasachensis]|uniref:CPBP family intramembrane glutamic endopeptidase n=1 Tax=Vibrio kasasachensis TaxID=2910248 RepID=UPI003D0D6C38
MELYIIPDSEHVRPFYKISIWILPVLLYIRLIDKNEPIAYLNLANKIDRSGWIFIIASLVILSSNCLLKGSISFNLDASHLINAVLLAGITEEIVFRGFIFKKLSEKLNYWSSNILQSILFTLIHIPIWILNNQGTTILFLYIFSFGLAMGYFAKKSKSLWTVVIIHSLHNLLI